MADFSAVLRKTIDGLSENTPAMRARVYDKARATVESKLAAVSPPPSPAAAERQRTMLEDAVAEVEADYAARDDALAPPAEPADEFDAIFAEAEADSGADTDIHAEPRAEVPPVEPRFEERPSEADAAAPETPVLAGPEDEFADSDVPPKSGTAGAGLLVTLVLLLILGGGAYGVWINREAVADMLGLDPGGGAQQEQGNAEPAAGEDAESGEAGDESMQASATADDDDAPDADEPAGAESEDDPATDVGGQDDAGEDGESPEKFTQRLLPDGEEVDPGPADDASSLGEGTSTAASTQQDDGEEDGAGGTADGSDEAAQDDAVPVGQEAIFYEERTNAAQGSADSGSVVWSVVEQSPGNDLPPEPAIRAVATVPDKELRMQLTISRNADSSLPASHIIEIFFSAPDDFGGGGIDEMVRFAMKSSEEDAGRELLSTKAKIADGYFLVALNDSEAEIDTNTTLLRRQSWIDIPVVYKSGRRALLTMEKGIPGERAFEEVLEAWEDNSSG